MIGVSHMPNCRQMLTICAISLKNTWIALVRYVSARAYMDVAKE